MIVLATSSEPSAGAIAAIAAAGLIYAIVVLAIVAFSVYCYSVVAKKAGYSRWLSLLMLVPLVNFVITLIFVFGEWPITAENRALRAQLGLPPTGPLFPNTPPPEYPTTYTPLTQGPGPITPA